MLYREIAPVSMGYEMMEKDVPYVRMLVAHLKNAMSKVRLNVFSADDIKEISIVINKNC